MNQLLDCSDYPCDICGKPQGECTCSICPKCGSEMEHIGDVQLVCPVCNPTLAELVAWWRHTGPEFALEVLGLLREQEKHRVAEGMKKRDSAQIWEQAFNEFCVHSNAAYIAVRNHPDVARLMEE